MCECFDEVLTQTKSVLLDSVGPDLLHSVFCTLTDYRDFVCDTYSSSWLHHWNVYLDTIYAVAIWIRIILTFVSGKNVCIAQLYRL